MREEIALIDLLNPSFDDDILLAGYLRRHRRVVFRIHQPTPALLAAAEASGGRIEMLRADSIPSNAIEVLDRLAMALKEAGRPPLERDDAEILRQNLEQAATLLSALEAVFRQYPIEALLVWEEYSAIGLSATRWAKRNNIPVFHVCHGISLLRHYTVHRPTQADVYCLIGAHDAELYRELGVPDERIVPIGRTRWEIYLEAEQARPRARRKIDGQFGFLQRNPLIVFASTCVAALSHLERDEDSATDTLEIFLSACVALAKKGLPANCLIKLHRATPDPVRKRIAQLVASRKKHLAGLAIAFEDAESCVLAADVLVGVESNMLAEAVIAGTPAINLWDRRVSVFGPAFTPDDGIIHVEDAAELSCQIERLLVDKAHRQQVARQQNAARPRFLAASKAGDTAANFAAALERFARPAVAPACREESPDLSIEPPYVWQTHLHSDAIEYIPSYHNVARVDLLRDLDVEPRRALDVGCAAGATFAELKKLYPRCETWGIEINPNAAKIAQEKLDHVIAARLEDVDFKAFGISAGSLDLILCADVLEHLYDPWAALLKFKELLAENGRLVISIPNLRYLPLLDELARGYFRYAAFGPLDITHIRFFTRKELERLFHETGFTPLAWRCAIDEKLAPLFDKARHGRFDLDLGKLVLRDIDEAEAYDLASAQFYITLRKGEFSLRGYRQPYLSCFFWQGTKTIAEVCRGIATPPNAAAANRLAHLISAHRLARHEAKAFDAYFERLGGAPQFDVLVWHDGNDLKLAAFLQDAARWLYDAYRLVIFAATDAPEAIRSHPRIGWRNVGANGETPRRRFWQAICEHLRQSEASWFVALESGDRLAEHALLYLAETSLRQPEAAALYADECRHDASMQPVESLLKPDFSPDYFLACDYLGWAVAMKREAFLAAGDVAATDAPLRRAQLILYRRQGAAGFSHVPDILWYRSQQPTLLRDDPLTAEEIAALFPEREITPGFLPGAVWNEPKTPAARVRLIVEATASLATMQALIEGFLGRPASPHDQELVIFAAADLPPDVWTFLSGIDALGREDLLVFQAPEGLDAVGWIVAAVEQSQAQAFVVLRPEWMPVESDWIARLAALALEPGHGLVAPRLISAEKKLVGNQLIFGVNGFAMGLGSGAAFDDPGYAGRLLTPQNPLAVTPDVVAFARAAWEQVGGLEAGRAELPAWIDFALRLHRAGRRTLWTPRLSFVAQVATERPRLSPQDEQWLIERWLPLLARDPAYNVNFSRAAFFQLTERPEITRLRLPWKPLPRLLAFPADTMGCGHYRVIEPFHAAREAGLIDGHLDYVHLEPYDMAVFAPDTIYLQRQVNDEQLGHLENYRRFFSSRIIYEIDDLITHVPLTSLHKPHIPKDIAQRLRKAFALCDRLIVTTEPLKEAFAPIAPEIRAIPNYLDRDKWGSLASKRRVGKKPRVGWAGGISHGGDLALIVDLVKATARDVDWIFMGFCLEEIKPYVSELVPGVPTPEYPAKLAALNLDLAIAPLAENAFNDCKSNLRLIEFGALGWPVIASDFGPYRRSRDFPGVTLVKNRFKDWLAALRAHLADLDECARRGDALREHIHRHWILQDHLEEWRSAWFDF